MHEVETDIERVKNGEDVDTTSDGQLRSVKKLTGRERSKLFSRIMHEVAHQKFINGVKE